ncbi:MAG: hypothetical protein HYU58_20775 [Proteobacteria bacterium]|nr:hypothetical protein [Pseudomonadota bacterium]
MRRMITLGPLLILTLLTLPMASHAEDRSDWRPIKPDAVEAPETIAKLDTAAGSTFSVDDAQAFLEQAGYAQITELEQINPFVWRATGQKDGATYALTVDYSGAVVGIDMP